MKRFLTLMLSLIIMCCAVVCSVSMVGCQKKECKKGNHVDADGNYICDACEAELERPHTHDFGTEWKTDEDWHWKECSCGEVDEEDYHVDEDNDGICDVCEYEMEVAEEEEGAFDGEDIGGGIALPPINLG